MTAFRVERGEGRGWRAGVLAASLAALMGACATGRVDRIRVSKAEGGSPVVRREPLAAAATGQSSAAAASGPSSLRTTDGKLAAAETLLQFLFDLADNAEDLQDDELRPEERPPGGRRVPEDGEGLPLGLSAAYARTRVWSRVRTSFTSASFPALDWNDAPRIGGDGAEVAFLVGGRRRTDAPIFGQGAFKAGFFDREYVSNSAANGALFARETVDTTGFWGDAALRIFLQRWLFVSGGAGVLLYRLRTDLQTNAPAFQYEGASGERILGTLNLSGGLMTPWESALKVFVEGTLRLTTDQEPALESAVGQFAAGLALRF